MWLPRCVCVCVAKSIAMLLVWESVCVCTWQCMYACVSVQCEWSPIGSPAERALIRPMGLLGSHRALLHSVRACVCVCVVKGWQCLNDFWQNVNWKTASISIGAWICAVLIIAVNGTVPLTQWHLLIINIVLKKGSERREWNRERERIRETKCS